MATSNGVILVCPDCGHPRFKWNATVVQTGGLQQFEAGQYEPEQVMTTVSEQEERVMCENCRLQFDRDELVAKTEYNDQ